MVSIINIIRFEASLYSIYKVSDMVLYAVLHRHLSFCIYSPKDKKCFLTKALLTE